MLANDKKREDLRNSSETNEQSDDDEEAPKGGTGKKKLYNFDILPPTNASPAPFVSTISSSLIGMIGYSVTLPSAKRLGKNLLPTFKNRAPDWEFGVKSR